jgi:hypothetical protein
LFASWYREKEKNKSPQMPDTPYKNQETFEKSVKETCKEKFSFPYTGCQPGNIVSFIKISDWFADSL